jgi:rhamnulokinase
MTPAQGRVDDAHHAAIDLGAGSGRAFVGCVAGGRVRLEEVHRFHYAPRRVAGHLRWDAARIIDGILIGIRNASDAAVSQGGSLASVGVDSWAVDYGLVDAEGRLLEDPICYRDERTEVSSRRCSPWFLARSVCAHRHPNQPFNRRQLEHARRPCRRGTPAAHPDSLTCSITSCEFTNASTARPWRCASTATSWRGWVSAGSATSCQPTTLGRLRPSRGGRRRAPVIAPATHDTGRRRATRSARLGVNLTGAAGVWARPPATARRRGPSRTRARLSTCASSAT